ncbi:MAG: hypothetical protein ACKO1U_00420 [Bacteroidota bacterium]
MRHIFKVVAFALTLIATSQIAWAQSCPGYRTYTQGGWSSTPSGNNPGTYLNNNFAAAFPSGLTIGCTRMLKLTSTTAIRNFLPSNGTPAQLPSGTLTNPTRSSYSNVLAGQLVALALTLRFDEFDPNFASNASLLRDLRIASGPFRGWTVLQLFNEANKKIGGCAAANFTFSQYNEALTLVNQNYDGLTTVTGSFLACPMVINGTPVNPLCYGTSTGSISVTVQYGIPPFSFLWSNGATTQNISGLSAGTYTVRVTDAGGATATKSFTITQPTQVVAAASTGGSIACNGGSTTVNVTASGGTGPYTGTGSFNVAAGTYSYTVTDANGCSASTSINVNQPPVLVASASAGSIPCVGGNGNITVTASGGTTPYSGTGTFSNPAGTYSYTVTDANGCSATASATLTDPTPITATVTLNAARICSGTGCNGSASVQATGGTGSFTYLWSNGSTTDQATGLCAGSSIAVRVTDANGCFVDEDPSFIQCQSCDTLTTFTQGGWGADPNGNNPGTYLHANFASAFPSGLTIGCTNTLTLTTAQAITDWLPSGTTPLALPAGNLVDDASYDNVLAAQLVAATLNVGFDNYDPAFAASTDALEDRFLAVAPFEGMTVGELLVAANEVIGGCSTTYSYTDLNAALTAINQNYDNGTTDNGDLSCSGPAAGRMSAHFVSGLKLKEVYPVPARDRATVSFIGQASESTSFLFTDLTGRDITSNFQVNRLDDSNFEVKIAPLSSQIVIMSVVTPTSRITRAVVIQ